MRAGRTSFTICTLIVRLLSSSSTIWPGSNLDTTRVGVLKGKVSYRAPEQIAPDEYGGIDRRADIFALGILLHETTTGRRLFQAASDQITASRVISG